MNGIEVYRSEITQGWVVKCDHCDDFWDYDEFEDAFDGALAHSTWHDAKRCPSCGRA